MLPCALFKSQIHLNAQGTTVFPAQGPFPLAHVRAWHCAKHFPEAMPVVHIGAPGLSVQLADLCARPLPVRPVAAGVAGAAAAVPASAPDRMPNGAQTHVTCASSVKQQPAHDTKRGGAGRAPAAIPLETLRANGDASGVGLVASEATPAMHNGAVKSANALSPPKLPEAVQKVDIGRKQPQHSTPHGVAGVNSVDPQQPHANGVPDKAMGDTKSTGPRAEPVRTVAAGEASDKVSAAAHQPAADAVPAPGAAASQPQRPADAAPETGASAVSAVASRPQLRSTERMTVGKSKYSITVRAKVACRLFADARAEQNCDAVVIAPGGTEYPVKLAWTKVRPCHVRIWQHAKTLKALIHERLRVYEICTASQQAVKCNFAV